MQSESASRIVGQALALRHSHPQAPALDVLVLAFQGVPVDGVRFAESTTAPGAPFGQVIAAAFDTVMTPAEWAAFTGPAADPRLQAGCLQIWRNQVLLKFGVRFGLAG